LSEKTPAEKVFSAFHEQESFADLILVMAWLAASVLVIYIPILNTHPVRYVLTIPLMFFIPGYSLSTALFPKKGDISINERIAISFGFSIAVVPLVGLGLNFIVISLTIFTLLTILVAYYRRVNLPFEERFNVPFHVLGHMIHQEFLTSEKNKTDRFLSVVLNLVIIIAILTAIYVIIFPNEGERYTEFFILGENRTADKYPDLINTGQDYSMYVGIGNHEKGDVKYTIETWMLLTEFDSLTNSSHILAMDPHDRLSLTLSDNETTIVPYNLSVNKIGYNRVEFLLFKDTIPGPDVIGNDRINASYRDVNLWITIY
jgi:uncharacterized membrane protein